MKKTLTINGRDFSFDDVQWKGEEVMIVMGEKKFVFSKRQGAILFEGKRIGVRCVWCPKEQMAHMQVGQQLLWASEKSLTKGKASRDEGDYLSPMPGKILKVLVKEGAKVSPGMPLLILEAMKMEHVIKAKGKGTISQINYGEGEQVEANASLIEIEDGHA